MAQQGNGGFRRGNKHLFPALLSILMVMVLALLMMPAAEAQAAQAVSVSYRKASWDAENRKVTYSPETAEARLVGTGTTTLDGGWYVVNEDVEISSRITVSGTVNLILMDGKTLTASAGITTTGATLNIYGQDEDTGILKATVEGEENFDAAIGGKGSTEGAGSDGGTLVIHGGKVEAVDTHGGAGIGGGGGTTTGGKGGSVTIYGGEVNAAGRNGGAGIGGGTSDGAAGPVGGTVTIMGGTVNASGSLGAGIGGGYGETNGGAGGTVTIEGGTVNATGTYGAGIGGGFGNDTGGAGGTVTITGGEVCAKSDSGAGIGGGYGDIKGGDGGTITIKDGTVTATCTGIDDNGYERHGTGIGGTCGQFIGGAGGTITIEGGTVTAAGGEGGAGIGGGYGWFFDEDITGSAAGGDGGTITITGGTVTATGGKGGAGIGGGKGRGYWLHKVDGEFRNDEMGIGGKGGTIRIEGGIVTAAGGEGAAGIGGGFGTLRGGAGADITLSGRETQVIAKGGSLGVTHSDETTVWLENIDCLGIGGGHNEDGEYAGSDGSLSVSSPLAVLGGASESALSGIAPSSDGSYERTHYMTVKRLSPTIKGHSLTLDGGKIGINFIIDPDDYDADTLSARILKDEDWESAPLTEKTIEGTDYLCFTIYVNAKEMTDSIEAELYGYGLLIESETYSVRTYYDAYMSSGLDDENTQALLEAMLTYGGMAQQYFEYNTEDLASEGISPVLPAAPKTLAKTVGQAPSGLTIRGASLLLEEDTSVRVYFDCSGDLSDYTFQVNGSEVTPQESENSANGQYYLSAEHIQSYNLDKTVSFVFQKGTKYRKIIYSPLCYIYSVQQKSDNEALRNLVSALYNYFQKAKEYVAA